MCNSNTRFNQNQKQNRLKCWETVFSFTLQ